MVNYYLRKWTTVFRYVQDIYHRATTSASPHFMTEIDSGKEDEAADGNVTGTIVIAKGSEHRLRRHGSTESVGEISLNEESKDEGD